MGNWRQNETVIETRYVTNWLYTKSASYLLVLLFSADANITYPFTKPSNWREFRFSESQIQEEILHRTGKRKLRLNLTIFEAVLEFGFCVEPRCFSKGRRLKLEGSNSFEWKCDT